MCSDVSKAFLNSRCLLELLHNQGVRHEVFRRGRQSGEGMGTETGREVTHRNEHYDREGVVHGVSAHSPPRQTDHLPSKGLSAAAGWGDGGWCGD